MARAVSTRTKVGYTAAAWIVALIIFFPILYTIITSFKSETEAIAGFKLIPSFTTESYAEVQGQYNYFKPFMNSVILSVGSTLLALLIAVPLAIGLAMAWKAVRLPTLEHYWRSVTTMVVQIILGVIGIAVGLYVLVLLVLPRLPAE